MSNVSEGMNDIAEVAAQWLIRQEGGLTAAEQQAFDHWLVSDPEHQRVFAKLRSLWGELGQAAVTDEPEQARMDRAVACTPSTRPNATLRARRPRRLLLRPAQRAIGGLAVAAAIGMISFHLLWYRVYADAATGVGEIRKIQLPDGSLATLNTNSAIRIRYTKERRAVELLSGEADFKVVADATRPFVVAAGGGSTRALGTEFEVRRSADEVSVTAIEHSIVVSYQGQDEAAGHSATLHPGERVHYSGRAGMERVTLTDTDKMRAWMHGRLIFEDEPLGNVIAELNRYHQFVIVVTDSRLNSLRINGVFRINDPIGAVDALEKSIGLHSIRVTDYVILIHS